jgi:hypothetical protein
MAQKICCSICFKKRILTMVDTVPSRPQRLLIRSCNGATRSDFGYFAIAELATDLVYWFSRLTMTWKLVTINSTLIISIMSAFVREFCSSTAVAPRRCIVPPPRRKQAKRCCLTAFRIGTVCELKIVSRHSRSPGPSRLTDAPRILKCHFPSGTLTSHNFVWIFGEA